MKKYQVPTFVKWAGGKTQLLQQYSHLFPKEINRYFEPMVGSGAVFFYIMKEYKPDFSMICDSNEFLIDLYKSIRDKPDKLINVLKNHKFKHELFDKDYYYLLRPIFNIKSEYQIFNETLPEFFNWHPKSKNQKIDIIKKSSMFIYFNKTAFNGLYRVNSNGEFNVPFGRYVNPSIVQEKKIIEASELLKETKIKKISFEKILNFTKEDDFIYFDPPYQPISDTSNFTSYQKTDFSEKDQEKLANVFKKLDSKNCKVMLSNSEHPLIKKLYDGYNTKIVKAKRMISCNGKGRGAINELVIRNFR